MGLETTDTIGKQRVDQSSTTMAVANDLILNIIRDIAGNDISNSLDGSSKIANNLSAIAVSVYRDELTKQ